MIECHGLTVEQLDAFVAGSDVFSAQRDGGSVAGEMREHGIMFSRRPTVTASRARPNG